MASVRFISPSARQGCSFWNKSAIVIYPLGCRYRRGEPGQDRPSSLTQKNTPEQTPAYVAAAISAGDRGLEVQALIHVMRFAASQRQVGAVFIQHEVDESAFLAGERADQVVLLA
jgi:hypothetical protein